MSKASYAKLNADQQAAVMAAGQVAEDWFAKKAAGLDTTMEETFAAAGVEIAKMSSEQAAAWRAIAQETSYKAFSEKVPGGDALIAKALAVE